MGHRKLVSPGTAAGQPVKTETDLGDKLAIFEFQLLHHWRKIAVACAVIVAACIAWGVANTVRSARENSAQEAVSAAGSDEAALEAAVAAHANAQAVNVARMQMAAAADGRGEYDRALKLADEIIASTGDAEFKCTVELFAAVNREKAGDLREAFRRFAAVADNAGNTASRRTEAAYQAGRVAAALNDRSEAAGYLGRAASGSGVYADMAGTLLRNLEASPEQPEAAPEQ